MKCRIAEPKKTQAQQDVELYKAKGFRALAKTISERYQKEHKVRK